MYVISQMKDTIRIAPHEFNKDFNNAISNSINSKIANKVFINSVLNLNNKYI